MVRVRPGAGHDGAGQFKALDHRLGGALVDVQDDAIDDLRRRALNIAVVAVVVVDVQTRRHLGQFELGLQADLDILQLFRREGREGGTGGHPAVCSAGLIGVTNRQVGVGRIAKQALVDIEGVAGIVEVDGDLPTGAPGRMAMLVVLRSLV